MPATKPESAPSPPSSLDQSTPSLLAVAPPRARSRDAASHRRRGRQGKGRRPQASTRDGIARAHRLPRSLAYPTSRSRTRAASAGEPVQLATGLDDQNKPAPAPNPPGRQPGARRPSRPRRVAGGGHRGNKTERRSRGPGTEGGRGIGRRSQGGRRRSSAAQPPVRPEPSKPDAIKPDLTPQESPKVEVPAPVCRQRGRQAQRPSGAAAHAHARTGPD